MVHSLPVAINFTLLGLYMRRVLWTPPWPTTNALNALQFAAKIHETLMVASLVTILLHHIRYRLLSADKQGLPLGLITSPFRLLDITYLCSREFRATLRNLGSSRTSEVITIVLHLFLFILAAVLGPASAISMLPRLREWELAKSITGAPFYSIHDVLPVYQLYMGAELSDIFPKTITASFNPEACDYRNLSLPQTNTCPRLGLIDILQDLFLPETGDAIYDVFPAQAWDRKMFYNITVQAHNQEVPMRTTMVHTLPLQFPPDDLPDEVFGAVADVTTPTDAIVSMTETMLVFYMKCWAIALKLEFDDDTLLSFGSAGERTARFTTYAGQLHSGESSSPWKQPYVSAFCSKQIVGNTASGFIDFTFPQQNGTLNYTVTLDSKFLSTALSSTGIAFISSSNLDITPSYTPSTALAFTSQPYSILCLVKAYWIDFTLSGPALAFGHPATPMAGLDWHWEATEGSHLICRNCHFRAEDAWFNHTNATETIHIDLEWLEVLDRGTGSDSTSKHSFFDKVRRGCLGSSILGDEDPDNAGKNTDLTCIAAGIGSGIAEGLSKVPYHAGIHALGTVDDGASPITMDFSPWTSSLSLVGWYYPFDGNWSNSTLTPSQIMTNSTRLDFTLTQKLHGYSFSGITIILAFVVLFLYVTTVLAHIFIVTFGTSWSSTAWKSLGEFYVLALQSPVPMSVLENSGGGVKVSKTWRARASVQELRHGRRVGIVVAEPGSGNGSVSEVRPDWKYS